MTSDEPGRPAAIEYVFYRHGELYRQQAGSVQDALTLIDEGEEEGTLSSIGIFVDGEPRIWDGYVDQEPPTPQQADEMRQAYSRARTPS